MIGIGAFMTSAATWLRSKALDVVALFAEQPGRTGFWYGDSYDEILERNREALGPNLVVNGDFASGLAGWTVGPSAGDAAVDASGRCVTTLSGANVLAYVTRQFATTPGNTYVACGRFFKGTGTSGNIRAGTTAAAANLGSAVGSTSDFLFFLFTATTNSTWVSFVGNGSAAGQTQSCDDLQVFEIADWSKLVLFDDANGTVPVFSPFQSTRGVGLLLDRSKGLVRGAERATASTVAGVPIGGPAYTNYTIGTVEANKFYEVTFTVSDYAGSGAVTIAGNAGSQWEVFPTGISGNGVSRQIVKSLAAQNISVFTRSTNTCNFSSISVRELPGNHRVQPTAPARGEISRLYNLLTGTDGATWAKTGLSSPLVEDASNGIHEMRTSTVALVAGVSYTQTARLRKKGTRRYFRFGVGAAFGTGGFCVFDLDTGTVTYSNNAAVVGSMSAVADSPGVFDCTVTFTPSTTATGTNYLGVNNNHSTGTSYAGVAGEGFEFLGCDLRLTADAIPSIPAYQRVTSPTDYDDAGFPAYHREQTDDWAYADIDPAGATKVLAMWGGQKLSDVAAGVIVESSVNSGGAAGTIGLFGPASASPSYTFRAVGSAPPGIQTTDSATAAPTRTVLRAYSDIPADATQLYVNGVQKGASTGDLGTGAFTAQRFYFGARAGTSLFANTRTFAPPMVLFMQPADPGPTESQLARLTSKFNQAAGVS